MTGLKRFIDAQNGNDGFPTYAQAEKEIRQGQKKTHWIWYVFPQLRGLGTSPNAEKFGIVNIKEACDYLENQLLFANYFSICQAVLMQLEKGKSLATLMGSPDNMKFISSLTLFQQAALKLGHKIQDYEFNNCCLKIFYHLRQHNYFPCQQTLSAISSFTKTQQPGLFFTEKNEQETSQTPISDNLSELSLKLGDYIKLREGEWDFHYNFLGIMSAIYWLIDAISGSDYYNNKRKEIKLEAAKKLKENIDHPEKGISYLTVAESEALKHDRLGELLAPYGGLTIINTKLIDNKSQPKQNSLYDKGSLL